jgi:Domain of unknown function (DUF4124)
MRIVFALLILSLAPWQQATAATYRCELEDGSVEYSNRPCPNAEEVDIQTGPTRAPATRDGDAEATADAAPVAPFTGYRVFQLIEPENGAVFTDTDEIHARLRVVPALRPEHWIAYYYDGRWAGSQGTLNWTIGGLRKGEHTLRFEIVNREDHERRFAATTQISFEIR